MGPRRIHCLLIISLAATAACRSRRSPQATTASATTSPAAQPAREPPLPPLVATSAAIAINNLDGQIEMLEKRSAERSTRQSLIELLLSRGQFLGRIADYERAAEVAETLVAEKPNDPLGYESRASTRSTFHLFDAALADLAEAEKLGAPSKRLRSARAAIYAATWRLDEAAALQPLDETTARTMELAGAGLLFGEMGDDARAQRLIARARDEYPDVSPFPLAWMDAQEGSLLERHGELGKARAHYVRAVTLLPPYARAASHLAGLSSAEEAIALLEPVTARSDDPEVLVQLYEAHKRANRPEDAERRLNAAIARYDELLAKYPAAFADHAAVMWLVCGRKPERALELARRNLAVRRTPEAYELLLGAAAAAKDEASVCADARAALSLKYSTESLRVHAARVAKMCP